MALAGETIHLRTTPSVVVACTVQAVEVGVLAAFLTVEQAPISYSSVMVSE